MIRRAGKKIVGRFRPPSPPGLGIAAGGAAMLALSVLLPISPLTRVFAQTGSGGGNQTKERLPSATAPRLQRGTSEQTTKGGQPGLLPYDVRSNPPGSQLPNDIGRTSRARLSSGIQPKHRVSTGVWLGAPRPSIGTTADGGSPTPTATPACPPTVINGSIDTGDPTQIDRLFRSFTPGNCDHSFTCGTFGDAQPRHYDAYNFTNTTGSTQCVTVDMNTACTDTNFIFTAAYLENFDPNNICINWIADEGESPHPQNQFSFKIDAGQSYVVVVSEVNASAGCPAYTMTVTCEPYQTPPPICPPTITQSTSQAIVAFNSLACSDPGLGTLENHYWRAFDMNVFTGGQAYNITSVEFGIEQALSLFGTDQPLTVNLYVNHGDPFPGGDWQSNLLATSGSINVPNQEGTIFNVPITATVAAGTLELVMEVLSPDQTVAHNFFLIGSNQAPENGPSYTSAPDCGNPDPVPWSKIGFPNIHQVFNVNGSCEGGAPTPTPTTTITPTPTPTVTQTPTPTATARPVPTPRPHPTPRVRPTPSQP
jgi:hypothetical protein